MPRERIFGNKLLDAATVRATGKSKISEEFHDTQSGLRAYSLGALDKIDFTQNGI